VFLAFGHAIAGLVATGAVFEIDGAARPFFDYFGVVG
jgi:hypothetical protein